MSATFVNCERCGAWETKTADDVRGECRRHAPAVVDNEWRGVWPITSNTEGCCDAVPQRAVDEF